MNTDISIKYSCGERLYITPVFVPKKNLVKTYNVYITKEFHPYDFPYEIRTDTISLKQNIKFAFYKLLEVIKYISKFSYKSWKYRGLYLRRIYHTFFNSIVVYGHVENDFCISIDGQLVVVDPHGYTDTYYLDPSQKYLHERFFESLKKDSELSKKWCDLQIKYPMEDYDLFFIAELDT